MHTVFIKRHGTFYHALPLLQSSTIARISERFLFEQNLTIMDDIYGMVCLASTLQTYKPIIKGDHLACTCLLSVFVDRKTVHFMVAKQCFSVVFIRSRCFAVLIMLSSECNQKFCILFSTFSNKKMTYNLTYNDIIHNSFFEKVVRSTKVQPGP